MEADKRNGNAYLARYIRRGDDGRKYEAAHYNKTGSLPYLAALEYIHCHEDLGNERYLKGQHRPEHKGEEIENISLVIQEKTYCSGYKVRIG